MKLSSLKCSLKIETSRALDGNNFSVFLNSSPFLLRRLYLQFLVLKPPSSFLLHEKSSICLRLRKAPVPKACLSLTGLKLNCGWRVVSTTSWGTAQGIASPRTITTTAISTARQMVSWCAEKVRLGFSGRLRKGENGLKLNLFSTAAIVVGVELRFNVNT